MAYYARVAAEIDAACERGELSCRPPRATMRPVWLPGDAKRLAETLWFKAVPFLIGFESSPAQRVSEATIDQRRMFEAVLPLDVRQPAPTRLAREARFAALRWIGTTFEVVVPWWFWLAVATWSGSVVVAVRSRSLDYRLILAASLLLAIGSRLVLLSLIEMTSFPGIRMSSASSSSPAPAGCWSSPLAV